MTKPITCTAVMLQYEQALTNIIKNGRYQQIIENIMDSMEFQKTGFRN